jgi:hypothetical protein
VERSPAQAGLAVRPHLRDAPAFSAVRAAEDGSFLNETVLENTLDPSPYLWIVGNADSGQANWQPMRCCQEVP